MAADSGTIRITGSTLAGATAAVEVPAQATVMEVKEAFAGPLGMSAWLQRLVHGAAELDNASLLADCGVKDGAMLAVGRDAFVISYGEPIGVFSNQNAGKGPTDTRLVLKRCDDAEYDGALRMGHEVGIYNEARTKRVDMGHYCVTDCHASKDSEWSRLIIRRLDGPSEGPIRYGHKVGIFSENGKKRLNMSTMGDPFHESWATRVFLLKLQDGELVRDDVECKGEYR